MEITVSTGEAASLLSLHPETVARMCRDGRIAALERNGRHRIPVSEIERLRSERAAKETDSPAAPAESSR